MPTPKILLVDDTRLFLELEKSFLKLSPVHVLTATNGIDALEICRNERPDLIYMDLHMPQMDGALCCAVLKGDPALRSIPVIMVTSAGKDEDVRLCSEAGCDDFLTKPVNRKEFLEKGRRFLNRIDRREIRVECRTPVKFKAHNVHFSGVSADISSGGIFVAADIDIEPKTAVELAFEIPETGCPLQGIRGKVAWRNCAKSLSKPDLPPGFGVEFIELPKEAAEIINSFVEINKQEQI
ncbi:MAG TPA: response regulator [Geobacteraceae bacterium]|nr:response regulator [Geobacteraceae bacterium]